MVDHPRRNASLGCTSHDRLGRCEISKRAIQREQRGHSSRGSAFGMRSSRAGSRSADSRRANDHQPGTHDRLADAITLRRTTRRVKRQGLRAGSQAGMPRVHLRDSPSSSDMPATAASVARGWAQDVIGAPRRPVSILETGGRRAVSAGGLRDERGRVGTPESTGSMSTCHDTTRQLSSLMQAR